MARAPRTQREPLFDAGWLFLIAGLLLIASAVMIPATRDLERAHFTRDRVLLTEMNRLHRLTRHEAYLGALLEGNERVALQLASTQLEQTKIGTQVIELTNEGPTASPSVFDSLEPPAIVLPVADTTESRLAGLVNRERSRLWVLAAASALVLIGLLPPSVLPTPARAQNGS